MTRWEDVSDVVPKVSASDQKGEAARRSTAMSTGETASQSSAARGSEGDAGALGNTVLQQQRFLLLRVSRGRALEVE